MSINRFQKYKDYY